MRGAWYHQLRLHTIVHFVLPFTSLSNMHIGIVYSILGFGIVVEIDFLYFLVLNATCHMQPSILPAFGGQESVSRLRRFAAGQHREHDARDRGHQAARGNHEHHGLWPPMRSLGAGGPNI